MASLALGIGAADVLGGVGGTVREPFERARILDDGGSAPIARRGSALAARSSLGRAGLKRELRQAFSGVSGGKGAYVSDAGSPRRPLLFSRSARTARLIASNTKLFTTAAFLDRFGADGRLTTTVWERGRRMGPGAGGLDGDLILAGDGDPALAKPAFADRNGLPLTSVRPLARAVAAAGIERIRGDVLADDEVFDRRRSVPQPGITGGPFLSTLSGLSFDSGFEGGRYATDPALNAARELIRQLRRQGVAVRGKARLGSVTRRAERLGAVKSPTVSRLIRETNTPSDNFWAETLLKRLAATPSRRGTTESGARKAERFARTLGTGVRMVNGSGLSRTNKASPRQVAKLLIRLIKGGRDRAQAFRDSLAIAGRSGTLATRMRGTAAAGRCQAKTGTLDGISVLSGYCSAGAGPVVYSILMNGVNIDSARRAQDKMVAAIARYK